MAILTDCTFDAAGEIAACKGYIGTTRLNGWTKHKHEAGLSFWSTIIRFHLTPISTNRKTGPMPVVTATPDTCPTSCALRGNGCYAEAGHLGMFWKKLASGKVAGFGFKELLIKIKALPRGQIWRYAQAGDLPDSRDDVLALAAANRKRPAIAYTHKHDFETYRLAADQGFNINLSADSFVEADELATTGLPVVVVISSEFQREPDESLREFRDRVGGRLTLSTPGGNKVAICPATYLESANCLSCGVCAKPRAGGAMIGFPAHGASKRKVDQRLRNNEGLSAWQPKQKAMSTSYSPM